MFGYIKPFKPEMKVSEFDTFQAVYCGLCKQLSHVFGPFASLTLSYDFTFASVLAIAMSQSSSGFKKCRCVGNPLKKKSCLVPSDDLTLCACAAMLMIYYKVKDDISDSSFLKKIPKYFLLPFVAHARKKAVKLSTGLDEIISKSIALQSKIEKDRENSSIDRAADPTAVALGKIFEFFSNDEKQKIILYRFGYLIGRYVYFADALDDLDEDIKAKGYNPFIIKFKNQIKSTEEIREYAKGVLNITVGEIPPAYELLELKRYKPILDNIIYLGLHHEMAIIINKKSEKNNKRGTFNEQSI